MGKIPCVPVGKQFEDVPDLDADPHEAAVVSIEAARVRGFVRGLPARLRLVIMLRYGLDCAPHSQAAIAARLGLARRTVRGLEQSALERLRASYAAASEAAGAVPLVHDLAI